MQETMIGCLIGAFFTWLASWDYYKRAGDDLKREAKNLFEQTQLILTALEQVGSIELEKNDGVVVGFKRWIARPKGWESGTFGNADIRNDISQPIIRGGRLRRRSIH